MHDNSRSTSSVGPVTYPQQTYVHVTPTLVNNQSTVYINQNPQSRRNLSCNYNGPMTVKQPCFSSLDLNTASTPSTVVPQTSALLGWELTKNLPAECISEAPQTRQELQYRVNSDYSHFLYLQNLSAIPEHRNCLQNMSTQPTMVYTQAPSDTFLNDTKVTPLSNPIFAQNVLNRLIGHEPCIHTLNYLEAQIETKKQIEKSQNEQLKTLREHSVTQEQEIESLTAKCRAKSDTIKMLKSQIGLKKSKTGKKKVPRLHSVVKGQQKSILGQHRKPNEGRAKDTMNCMRRTSFAKSNRRNRSKKNQDVISFRDRVSKQRAEQDELARLKEENEVFRLEIGRLERENTEVVRLRQEVVDLRCKCRDRLENTSDDQSISTGQVGRLEVA